MNFCSQCGNELREQDVYCSGCGVKIQRVSDKESEKVSEREAEKEKTPAHEEMTHNQTRESGEDASDQELLAGGEGSPAQQSSSQEEAELPSPESLEAAESLESSESAENEKSASVEQMPPSRQDATSLTSAENSGTEHSGIPAGENLQSSEKSRKGLSGMVKVLIAFLVIIAVSATGGYVAGKIAFSPDRVIESFRQAIVNEDIDKLMKLIRPGSDSMGMSRKDVARLADYYQNHESDLERAVSSLQTQADGSSDRRAVLRLIKEGKEFFLFDRYMIEIPPYYMTLHTNLADTELLVEGEEVATARTDDYSKRFGPYWPGEYEVEAVYAGEYVTLNQSKTVKLYEERDEDVYLQIEAGYVQMDADLADAVVFVNGVSTERTVSELDYILGPVSFDGSITLHAEAEFPWGTFESEPIVLYPELENAYVPFIFVTAYETVLEQVMDAVNEYLFSWVMAYENMDISRFTNITEERRSMFISDFQWMLDTEQRFTGDIVGTEFDLDSFILDGGYGGQPYRAFIDTAFILENAAWYFVGEEPQTGDMVSFISYELIYDEYAGKWIIAYFTALDGIDFSNTQAYIFEG